MTPTQEHWVCTYSDYIDEFLADSWDYHPGEHHFVGMYLLPRMIALRQSLGLPYYVNPDGMKKQPGDLVYYFSKSVEGQVTSRWCRLAIEVKQAGKRNGKLPITRSEYNLWIGATEAMSRKPHLVVAVCKQGVFLMGWQDFCAVYLKHAYPDGAPADIAAKKPAKNGYTVVRNANSFDPAWLDWSGQSPANGVFPYKQYPEKRLQCEASFVAYLKARCEKVWTECETALDD